MLRLHTLGRLRLLDSEGRELGGSAIRPKRLALLAYLAAARPLGFHRRDSLVGLFWPELDQQRARHSLSQGLHTIRRALGDAVVVTRGMEEVGLDRELFWCDVPAFDQAMDRGSPAEALELYHGDLLDGVFVADAPGFEHWLEDERARLRQRAALAARTLTEQCTKEGRVTNAMRWAARAAELDPLDERSLRRLMRARDRAGDRAGALLAYQSFSERLREELDVEPSPETRSLVDEIRSREELLTTSTSEQLQTGPRKERVPIPEQAVMVPTLSRAAVEELRAADSVAASGAPHPAPGPAPERAAAASSASAAYGSAVNGPVRSGSTAAAFSAYGSAAATASATSAPSPSAASPSQPRFAGSSSTDPSLRGRRRSRVLLVAGLLVAAGALGALLFTLV